MSRTFTNTITEYINSNIDDDEENEDYISSTDEKRLKDADSRVKKGSRDPEDQKLSRAFQQYQQKKTKSTRDIEQKIQKFGEAEGDQPEPMDAIPNQEVPTNPTPQPPAELSSEGEAHYVNLARKALFVDLDSIHLTSYERDVLTDETTPENAKKIAEIVERIISEREL